MVEVVVVVVVVFEVYLRLRPSSCRRLLRSCQPGGRRTRPVRIIIIIMIIIIIITIIIIIIIITIMIIMIIWHDVCNDIIIV